MKQTSSIQSSAWNVEYDFTDAKFTDFGGMSFAVRLIRKNGLCGLLKKV